MDGAGGTADYQVCEAQKGQFIAFWRGQVVSKLDGSLRYFASEQAAREFLARRNAAGNSMAGSGRRSQRSRPVVVRPG